MYISEIIKALTTIMEAEGDLPGFVWAEPPTAGYEPALVDYLDQGVPGAYRDSSLPPKVVIFSESANSPYGTPIPVKVNPVQVSTCRQVRLDDPFPGVAPTCPICGRWTFHRPQGWVCGSTVYGYLPPSK